MGEMVAFRADPVDRVSELSIADEASIEDVVRSKGYELAYLPDAIVTNHGPDSLKEYFDDSTATCGIHEAHGQKVCRHHPRRA